MEVILCFAIVYLNIGGSEGVFNQKIENWVTALYYSMVTFASLGYGDILPLTEPAKLVVMAQIFFLLMFLALRLPLAVSVLRVQVKPSDADENVNAPLGQ
jgi:voltage-gated potassium channel Kch